VTRNLHNFPFSSSQQWVIKKQANTTKMKCKCARIFPPEKLL